MKSFLSEILSLIDGARADDLNCPYEPLKSGDRTIGACSTSVRILGSYLSSLKERLGDYEACLERSKGNSVQSARHLEWRGVANDLRQKVKVIEGLINVSIAEDMPQLKREAFYVIRKGWIVVVPKHDPTPVSTDCTVVEASIVIVSAKEGASTCGRN